MYNHNDHNVNNNDNNNNVNLSNNMLICKTIMTILE